ncbi:hypothetical protein ES332_A08G264800v1 [Gossypium tomentosum]|uniref:Uncharacterized protein n=1 Tax=Gossypium tomentosum TaxID=34277 RepID=A0A5D2PK31_GOSTO|nr:hypothetical protein ES332_A08G264800v1 [Gossypium tomentosum]
MEQKRILFLVAVLLGIISVFTGFGAEITRVKASQVEIDWYGDCSYPKSPAHVLGLVSAATLLTAKIIMIPPPVVLIGKELINLPTTIGIKLFSYILLLGNFDYFFLMFLELAIVLLLKGAVSKDQNDQAIERNDMYYCPVVKAGIFAVGASFAAISFISGVLLFQTLNPRGEDANNAPIPNEGGVQRCV